MAGEQAAGPSFPFRNSVEGVLGNKTRRESIRTSIQLILSTPKQTILYNPNLGSYVPRLVFDPLDDTTINLLLYYTKNDLEEQEPRIQVTSISITTGDEPHEIRLWVGYIDRNDIEQKQEQAPINFKRG